MGDSSVVGGSRKRWVRGHLWGFKSGGWAQRSDATLEALVIWWSVGGWLEKIHNHTQSQ
jgi:hypothetical protein